MDDMMKTKASRAMKKAKRNYSIPIGTYRGRKIEGTRGLRILADAKAENQTYYSKAM